MASKKDTGDSSQQPEGSSTSPREDDESSQMPGAARPSQSEGPPGPSSEQQAEDSIHTAQTQEEEEEGEEEEGEEEEEEEEEDSRARIPDPPSNHQKPLSSPAPSVTKPKKPALGQRRTSIKPHRGQEFSIDDDPAEYEELEDQVPVTQSSSIFGPPVRRQAATLRRRSTIKPTSLSRVDSQPEEEEEEDTSKRRFPKVTPSSLGEEEPMEDDDADLSDVSDAESFTLKDRQQAINQTHPFGIRIWQPALYKKSHHSMDEKAEKDIHSTPGGSVSIRLWFFNICWTSLFGWWLAAASLLGAGVCYTFAAANAPGAIDYGHVFWGLAGYVLWPFGKFVSLESDETYAEEDEGYGRSPRDYEQWQSGDLEHGRLFFGPESVGHRRTDSANERNSLLGNPHDDTTTRIKRRLFGRGEWTAGRIIFFILFYFLIGPLLLVASAICWLMVFSIPMGRVTLILRYHLRRHPLALSFHSAAAYSRSDTTSSILLCTYRAVGIKYWKYTIDGTNVFIINLLAVVLFTIIDFWFIGVLAPGASFALALLSIIPLAFFIGQAVASISAQSSMGVGAAVNAFFSTIVEIYLYCVALNDGKSRLVEGSLIGSVFAGVLFLPGLSMCFGAVKRKTQRFNIKSAGATSTMLLFAIIAVFGPTLFYNIYGVHEVSCQPCSAPETTADRDCRRCFSVQVKAITDRFFATTVLPYCWFAAVMLVLSYMIGLWFTLRTHASIIWATEEHHSHPPQHLNHPDSGQPQGAGYPQGDSQQPPPTRSSTFLDDAGATSGGNHDQEGGGHDAPNWSRMKSFVILLSATVAYAIIAEVLVDTVDVILESVDIDEKFLGLTLFALVPNTTEFLNAISFAMNGNVALSMEIGSAYTLQVCLIQIPAVVLYSAVRGQFLDPSELVDHTFNLIFAQWDMVTVILCVFLLSYTYGEGKSNYFKGSILILAYFVVMAGFYISGYDIGEIMDTAGSVGSRAKIETSWMAGRTRSGKGF